MLPEFGNQENLSVFLGFVFGDSSKIFSDGLNQQFAAFLVVLCCVLVSGLRVTFRIFTFEDFRIFIRASTEVSLI